MPSEARNLAYQGMTLGEAVKAAYELALNSCP